MTDESKSKAFRMVLKYLNQGKKTFRFNEIDSASDDGVTITDLSDVMRKMTEDKILSRSGIEQYDIIVDIGTLRNYVLKQTEIEREVDEKSCKTPIDKIMKSSWTAVKPNTTAAHNYVERIKQGSDFKEDSDSSDSYCFHGKVYDNKIEYLEAKQRELMRRLQESIDDDEEEDEDDDKGDSISDEYEDNEELYRDALKFCIERGVASVSLIQRHFPIGYIKSCKIIDWMENNDFISPQIGSKPRRVLIDRNDYENIFDISFDKQETEIKEPGGDSTLGGFLKRRVNAQDRKNAAQNLVNALSRVAEKKNAPITRDNAPGWSLWSDKEFEKVILERLERIIKSDRRMGRQGAIKKAETYLEVVRDTHDRKMVQVYERIVYEFKTASDYIYRQIKKQIFE